jgi:acyl homoserine lactone synthase
MIDAISLATAHLLGDALPSAYRLRHRIFVERQRYEVPHHRGMEWDQFDTPAAVYLLWRDQAARVRAITRVIPTSLPYMIQQLWPELVHNRDLPTREDVWEVTRFGIDRDLDRRQRARIFGEMFCALAEYALKNGIGEYIFVTPAVVIDSGLGNAGVEAVRLGQSKRLGRLPVIAARLALSYSVLAKLRRYHGISGSVLRVPDEMQARAA